MLAALAAADKIKEEIRRRSNRPLGDSPDWRAVLAGVPNLSMKAERPADRASAPGINSAFDAAGMMGAIFKWILKRFAHLEAGAGTPSAVEIAEVEVDMLLGRVRVLHFHSGLAVGRLAAPQLARSQAEGSIVQGIGYALYEGRQIDQTSGQILTTGLEDYRIPGIADTPDMDIHFDETASTTSRAARSVLAKSQPCRWQQQLPMLSTMQRAAGFTKFQCAPIVC